MSWTNDEVSWLIENYPSLGKTYCAKHLGKSLSSIRMKTFRLGLKQNTDSEFFKDWQERAAKSKVGKKRPEQALVIKRLHEQGKLIKTEQYRRNLSVSIRSWHTNNEHPKGMLGKIHSKKTLDRLSEASKSKWANPDFILNQEPYRQELSDRMHNSFVSGKRNSINNYSRAKSGKREDLNGLFVRSAWEANYARYLNLLIKSGSIFKWEYEPDTFVFHEIKRGTRSYTPDFKVWDKDNDEFYYIEIKGWMDAKSKTKLSRMAKYYPEVTIRLVQKKEYMEIKCKASRLISEWE